MQCDRAQEFFSDYLERTLDRPLTIALESHLAGCASCREEVESLQAICYALDTVPEVEPPKDGAWQVMAQLRAERAKQYEEQRNKPPTFLQWLRSLNPLSVAMGASLATFVIGGTLVFNYFGASPDRLAILPVPGRTSRAAVPAAPGAEMPAIQVQYGNPATSGQQLTVRVTPAVDLPDGQVRVIGAGLPVESVAKGSMRQGAPLDFPLTIPPGTDVQVLRVLTRSDARGKQYEQLVVVPLAHQHAGAFSANLYRAAPDQAFSQIAPALGHPVVVDGVPTAPVTLQVNEQPAGSCLDELARQVGMTVRQDDDTYHLTARP